MPPSPADAYLADESGNALARSAAFGILFTLAALPGCFVWLAFGASLQGWLRTERAARVFNVAMALILLASMALLIR